MNRQTCPIPALDRVAVAVNITVRNICLVPVASTVRATEVNTLKTHKQRGSWFLMRHKQVLQVTDTLIYRTRDSFMKHESHQRYSVKELDWADGDQRNNRRVGKSTRWPLGLITILRKQPLEVKKMLRKCLARDLQFPKVQELLCGN